MSLLRWLLPFAVLVLTWLRLSAPAQESFFLTDPYLQLGESFSQGDLAVVWHRPREGALPQLQFSQGSSTTWTPIGTVDRLEMDDRVVFTASLPVGRSGEPFRYRFLNGEAVVFEASGRAPSTPGTPIRVAVTGDGGDGEAAQRELTMRMLEAHQERPLAFTLLTGDLVYPCGQRDEYQEYFFPVYNGDPDSDAGGPLMRQVPFVGAVGNHDVGDKGWWIFDRCTPDYSYFAFWRHPSGFAGPLPVTPGHPPKRPAGHSPFTETSLPSVLPDANFSFTWSDIHVTVLDSNKYVDWSDPALRQWLEDDLARAQASRWRVVAFHHPAFHLSAVHDDQQWMRALAPVFERHRVTMVIAGHVHNFQWFGPARFEPEPDALSAFGTGRRGRLAGRLELLPPDAAGVDGPIYLVSGAGGHNLKDQGAQCPKDLRPVPTDCLAGPPVEGGTASVTLLDISPDAIEMRQISASGEILLTRQVR